MKQCEIILNWIVNALPEYNNCVIKGIKTADRELMKFI